MVISLPPGLKEELDTVMGHGQYASVEDALRHAIHLLREEQKLEHLRGIIAESIEVEERGDVRDVTPELLQEIRANATERFRSGIAPDPDVCP